ncbi:MAG: flagellar hook-associated protein FlgL [Bdellovibrionales bacterium]|nr:flagellar hook-associated protein FlgL [Bdellovibrionales bacterium]
MRVADTMAYDQVLGNLGKNRTQMSELQNQAATQKRVTKPSDDPISASRVLNSRIDFEGNKQFIKNLNYTKSFLDTTDQALGEVGENLMRVKELAISQSNDASANEESRRVVATEVEQIFNQVVNIGNRKLGDRFIFAGFKTQSRPFGTQGQYLGDDGEMMIHIDKATFLPMNISGNRVFLGEGFSSDGKVKPSMEQPQTIEEWIGVKQDLSSNMDVNEDNLKRKQNESETKGNHLPLRGPSSLRMPPLDLKGTKESSQSSEKESSRTSEKESENAGVNLFKVLKDLEVSLRTNDKKGVQDSLDSIDSVLSQVVLARSQVGSRGMAVESLLQSLEKAKVDNQVSISQLEDANVYSTVSDINKTESTLQATLQTSGKLIQPTLLQFLR